MPADHVLETEEFRFKDCRYTAASLVADKIVGCLTDYFNPPQPVGGDGANDVQFLMTAKPAYTQSTGVNGVNATISITPRNWIKVAVNVD